MDRNAITKSAGSLELSLPISVCTLLSDRVFFLFTDNGYSDNSVAADSQNCKPQSKVAVVAGLRRLRQLRRYGVGFGDFLGAVFASVILIAAAAVPILDVALGILGRRLGREML